MGVSPALTVSTSMGRCANIIGLVKFALPANWKRIIANIQTATAAHQKAIIVVTLTMGIIAVSRSLRYPHPRQRLTTEDFASHGIAAPTTGTSTATGIQTFAIVSIAPS